MTMRRKYRWEEWFGRESTTLVRGIDYHCSQSAMASMIRNRASQHHLGVQLTDTGTEILIEMSGKYLWDEWFNGDLLLLEKSTDGEKKDFDGDVDFMEGMIEAAARLRYKVCQISDRDADRKKLTDSLIIRARDMTAEERVAEDRRRAGQQKGDTQMAIRSISRQEFDSRVARGTNLVPVREHVWLADDERDLLGTVLFDQTDQDWNYAILGPDGKGKYTWVRGDGCLGSQLEAEVALRADMASSGGE